MDFGCERCWPDDPAAAWEARRGLDLVADLIDESHFHVMVLACGHCGQRFVSVFTEIIDWTEGDDPQHWTLMPLTDSESAGLLEAPEPVTEAQIDALGPGRRSLNRDRPKGEETSIYWTTGIWILMHD